VKTGLCLRSPGHRQPDFRPLEIRPPGPRCDHAIWPRRRYSPYGRFRPGHHISAPWHTHQADEARPVAAVTSGRFAAGLAS